MDTNSQHKDILFLVSLSPEIIIDLEKKNIDYSYFLNKIRSFANVDFRESISKEDLAIANNYKIVIVIGHRKGESLELSDQSLFPMADIVTSLPFDFSGVIDVSVCNSTVIHDAIKKHCPNALVQTANEKTGIDFRLPLYSILLNHLPANINYRDAYILLLKRMEAKQSLIPKQELDKRPTTTKLGTMATGERPFEVKRNSKFFIKVIFHDESAENTIEHNIVNAKNICYKIKNSLLNEIKDGDAIQLDLCFDTYYSEMKKHLEGEGSYGPFPYEKNADNIVEFKCFVKAGFLENNFDGTLTIRIKDNIVDKWRFMIWVTPHINESVNNFLSTERGKDYSDNRKGIITSSQAYKTIIRRTEAQQLRPKGQKSRTNTKDFAQCVTYPQHAKAVIKKLHELIDDKVDDAKGIMMCIRAAMDAGAIVKPSFGQFCKEFGDEKLKSKTSFNDYTDERYKFNVKAFDLLKERFKELVS